MNISGCDRVCFEIQDQPYGGTLGPTLTVDLILA